MTDQSNEFPCSIIVDGIAFYSTGKLKTNIRTGKRVAEMEADDASRVWVAADGSVFPE